MFATTPLAAAPVAGSIADSDFIAPIDVQVSPLVARDAIATRDGKLLPAVARLDAAAADTAERAFDLAFAQARVAFLDALERDFGARAIDEGKVGSRRFQDFRSEFLAAHPEFPVGYVLAGAWARGDDGELTRARLSGVLRQVMARHLIGSMPRAATVFVVDLPRATMVRSWDEASSMVVRAVDGADVVTLAGARAELWRNLGVGERFAGGFLETLVRENVSYDARLTALFLHERLGAALEGRFIGRGELIVQRGQPIDALAAEALRELDLLGLAPLMPMPAANVPRPEPARVPVPAPVVAELAPAAMALVQPAMPGPRFQPAPLGRWMMGVVAVGLFTLGLGLWVAVRLRRLRAVAGTALVVSAPPAETGLRALLVPHLAREMVTRGMQALFSQRQVLLQNEAAASVRVAEMETRVARVQPAIQERMKSYERRIMALERELQEK